MLAVFQLEDDVIAKADYYSEMKTFATQEASKQWLYTEFSQLGFIGVCVCIYKMYSSGELIHMDHIYMAAIFLWCHS